MAKISQNVLEDIKARLSIVDLVSQYLTLNRKGDRYWGLCPFHEEKTPSFSVLPDKGFFHCFGCGKSGSLFDFYMEMEHLTFPESVRALAESLGIQIEEENPQEKRKRNEREVLSDLYTKLASSFHYILTDGPQAETAREYLRERGIDNETIEHFQIGYAPADPSWLYSFLNKKNYSDTLLKNSGLFSRNGSFYPLFRDRIIFPIRSWKGEVVAFGGRDISGTSKAKYINTPEIPIFRKREVMYGLHEALAMIKQEGSVILCEGYFDVIALYRSGKGNACAPMGTSFTHDQARLLKRYASKIQTLFDSDHAGKEATKKALIVCEQVGLEGSVITLRGAKDPDEFLSRFGSESLSRTAGTATAGFDYLVHSAKLVYDSNKATGKLQILQELTPYLQAVDSHIVRQTYLHELSRHLQLDESALLHDFNQESRNTPGMKGEREQTAHKEMPKDINVAHVPTDLYLMLIIMNNRELFARVRNRIPIGSLQDSRAVTLYTLLENSLRDGTSSSDELMLSMIEDENLRRLVVSSFVHDEFSTQAEKSADELMNRITLRTLKREQKKIEHLIAIAAREGSSEQDISQLLYDKKGIDEDIAVLIRKSIQ